MCMWRCALDIYNPDFYNIYMSIIVLFLFWLSYGVFFLFHFAFMWWIQHIYKHVSIFNHLLSNSLVRAFKFDTRPNPMCSFVCAFVLAICLCVCRWPCIYACIWHGELIPFIVKWKKKNIFKIYASASYRQCVNFTHIYAGNRHKPSISCEATV